MQHESKPICTEATSSLDGGLPVCEQVSLDQHGLLSNDEAARMMRISPRTLPDWRTDGTSPPFIRVGRRVFYRRGDVERWLQARRVVQS